MRARTVVFWLVVAACLLPALTLTVARLTDPSGSLGIALVALTPFGLPLYGVVLVLAAVVLLRRRRWRSAALPVALVAVAGLALHGWWFAPQISGTDPAADGADPTVVMTANLYFGTAAPAAVVAHVRDDDVDLLVVNEITEASVAGLDAAGLADLLPHRVGAPAPDGDGTATMAFSREPISDVAQIPMLQEAWLFTTGGVTVAAVHVFAPNEPELWREDLDALTSFVAAQEPDLVVGDLNATVDHAPIRRLVADGWRDAGEIANAGWQPTWPAMRVRRIPGFPLTPIDHVLVGPRLTALSQHTVDLPGSDHRGSVVQVAPRR